VLRRKALLPFMAASLISAPSVSVTRILLTEARRGDLAIASLFMSVATD
jgi:hypothetical protein